MGAIFGVLFGAIDVEDDDLRHTKFKENLIWSIPIGGAIGGFLGFMNQWIRSSSQTWYESISSPSNQDNI